MSLPTFSIVTSCKGRLDFLRRALPTFVQQQQTEVVVVDYDCPDGTKDWIASHFPDVRVAKVSDAPIFNLSRARNIGAKLARAPWLVFCDADQLLAPSFASELLAHAVPGTYLRTLRDTPAGPKVQPFPLACEAATFWALGGYDDAFRGWGAEDWEFVRRLNHRGLREVLYPAALVETLRHTNAARSSHYEHKIDVSMVINHHYARIKERYFDTRRHWFTDEQRFATYELVERAVVASLADTRSDTTFEIAIPGSIPPWTARVMAGTVREYHRSVVDGLSRVTL